MRRNRSHTRAGKAKISGARAVAGDLLRARQAERDEDGEEQEIDPAVLASGSGVIQAMEVYFKSRRLYQEDYPPLQRVLEQFAERMRVHLETHDTLTVSVASRAIEIAGHRVYEVERADHNMCFPLFRDGIRELTFTSGLATDELVRFVRALVTLAACKPGDTSDEGEDDAVTLLWDLELDHISYIAIDTFANDSDPAARARLERIEELVTVSMTRETPGLADSPVSSADRGVAKQTISVALQKADFMVLERANLAALDDVPERLREQRADLLVLDDDDRAALVDTLADDKLIEKFVEAAARAALGAQPVEAGATCTRLEQLFAAIVTDAKFAHATTLRGHAAACVGATFDACELLPRIGRAMSAEAPMAVVTEALVNRPDDTVVEVMDLVRVLPATAAAPLITTLPAITDARRRRAVCDIIASWGVAVLDPAAAALPASTEEHALDLLYIVRRLASERSTALLEQASTHAAPSVRAGALRLFADRPGPALDRRARAALADPDPGVRAIGLDLVAARKPEGAARWLEALIDGDDFESADVGEKKRVFATYALVGGDAAAKALLDRLGRRNLLHKTSVDESRIAAACALGQIRYEEARPLLAKLAKTTLIRGEVKRACVDALAELDKPAPPAPTQPLRKPPTGEHARLASGDPGDLVVSFRTGKTPVQELPRIAPAAPAAAPPIARIAVRKTPSDEIARIAPPAAPVVSARTPTVPARPPPTPTPAPVPKPRPIVRPRALQADDRPVPRSLPKRTPIEPIERIDPDVPAIGSAVTAIPVIRDDDVPPTKPTAPPPPTARPPEPTKTRPIASPGYHSMTRKKGGGEKLSVKLPKDEPDE